MEKKLERIGDKLILKINCLECPNSSNLNDPNCRKCVAKTIAELAKGKQLDAVSIINDFRRVYPISQIELLTQLSDLADSIKLEKFPLVYKGDYYLQLVKSKIVEDPVKAYLIAKEQSLIELPKEFEKRRQYKLYKKKMEEIAKMLEKTSIISIAMSKKRLDNSVYSLLFVPWTIPSFVTSHIAPVPDILRPVEEYYVGKSKVSIYKIPNKSEHLYAVNPPEFLLHADESRAILNALDEISKKEPEIIDPRRAREYFKSMAKEIISRQLELDQERLEELADITARYSAGYGLLEALLADERLQDIYVDSPGNNFIYVYHEKYEDCITNVLLSQIDLERIAARFRAISGRPFDESAPVLHTEIPEYQIRVAGLHPPATFGGIGFAFRRSRPKPWTLPQFIRVGMMSPEVAGLISFLVSGESSMLITGARGSGKTSLLASVLGEIESRHRIIVIEDTPELPVDQLKKVGFKIQHVRVKAAIGSEDEAASYELSADAALRTALRLGESVLVLGEVRGPEARALFEAMRVGAAGNVVLGTIHGSSAYDTWDRVVNDLGVPTTSFKATDIVVSTAAVRRAGDLVRKRRVMAITEVRKEWERDPFHEDGFYDLVKYDSYSDKWITNDLERSEILKRIADLRGVKLKTVLSEISTRGKAKELLVKKALESNDLSLLEIEKVVKFNIELNKQINSHLAKGKIDQSKLLHALSEYIDFLEAK